MSFEITTAFVNQYTTNVSLLLQQRGTKLRDAVTTSHHVGKAAKVVEQLGSVAAVLRTSRHQDTPLISTPHDARWIFPSDYVWADMIDDVDKLRMLIDPTSAYAVNGAYAIGRAMDLDIINAAFSTAKTGENGTTDTAFDTSTNQIPAGGAGLTVAKLRTAKKILLANEVDVENDPMYIALSAKQLDDLLGTTEVTSDDFVNVKALVDGSVNYFMGFHFIHTELLGLSGSNRRVIAWAKSGLHLGIWNDLFVRISERDDKMYSHQVYVAGSCGATRVEEKKVVEILCVE